MTVETYKGPRPACRNCGKPLRPVYETVNRSVGEEGQYRRVYLGAINLNNEEEDRPDRDIYDKMPWPWPVFWDEEKGQWYRMGEVGRVNSRRFTGRFGVEGCGLFCTVTCGFRWACKKAKEDRQ